MKERRSATVMRNGYVTFRLHHYSVPKEYIGKRVEIVYDADTLEIYHGLRLVTTHQRDDTPYSYTTKDAHGLPGRHGSYEKDLEQIYERAGQTDNVLRLYLRKVAELKKYPPAAFRSCRGIMALEKTFGLERLVAASACATQLRLYGYQEIRRILDNRLFPAHVTCQGMGLPCQCSHPTPYTRGGVPLQGLPRADRLCNPAWP